ncbi:MAG: caspase family protein [Gammaproteobacteria bacterium]|nr:caspase family protein [Gammaproteobacteria bacterium]
MCNQLSELAIDRRWMRTICMVLMALAALGSIRPVMADLLIPAQRIKLDKSVTGSEPVAPTQRIALVIGNGAYTETTPLQNPTNDAKAIAALLHTLGFKVTVATDLKLNALRKQVRDFIDAGHDAHVRMFYYTGMGVCDAGQLYLLPIGAQIHKTYETPDQAFPLATLLRGLESIGQGNNLVMLDTCVQDCQVPALARTVIFQAGNVALDQPGEKNSLFTKHLLLHLGEREELDTIMAKVRKSVYEESHGDQLPKTISSLDELISLGGFLENGSSEQPTSSVTESAPSAQ